MQQRLFFGGGFSSKNSKIRGARKSADFRAPRILRVLPLSITLKLQTPPQWARIGPTGVRPGGQKGPILGFEGSLLALR